LNEDDFARRLVAVSVAVAAVNLVLGNGVRDAVVSVAGFAALLSGFWFVAGDRVWTRTTVAAGFAAMALGQSLILPGSNTGIRGGGAVLALGAGIVMAGLLLWVARAWRAGRGTR